MRAGIKLVAVNIKVLRQLIGPFVPCALHPTPFRRDDVASSNALVALFDLIQNVGVPIIVYSLVLLVVHLPLS